MGRATGLANALRAEGLQVEEYQGWTTRGSDSFDPRGAVCHWTGGPRDATGRPSLNTVVNGRPDLPGPLANTYLDRNGIAVVVAAGRANHAGEGGWQGLSGNSSVFGTEAECGGDGDWTPAQHEAYPKVNAAYCRLGDFDFPMVCGHNEWAPNRKIDIRDWPMSLMRQQVAGVLQGGPPATRSIGGIDVAEQLGAQWLEEAFCVSVVRGTDGTLYSNHWNTSVGKWSGWSQLPGQSKPVKGEFQLAPASKQLDVFARADDNSLWHWWFIGGKWSGPDKLGGQISSPA